MSDLRRDIEAEFRDLRKQLGVDDDIEEADDEFVPDEPVSPPSPAHMEPPAPALPEDPEVPGEVDVEATESIAGDEEETYPGSRHVRRGLQEEQEEEELDEEIPWDTDPVTYIVEGREREFFRLGALSIALKRSPITLRKWEEKGYLPSAPFRSPGKKQGDRMYSRAHIKGLQQLAQQEGLLGPLKKPRIDQTRFPDRAHRLFDALKARSST